MHGAVAGRRVRSGNRSGTPPPCAKRRWCSLSFSPSLITLVAFRGVLAFRGRPQPAPPFSSDAVYGGTATRIASIRLRRSCMDPAVPPTSSESARKTAQEESQLTGPPCRPVTAIILPNAKPHAARCQKGTRSRICRQCTPRWLFSTPRPIARKQKRAVVTERNPARVSPTAETPVPGDRRDSIH
jgi:hypothetical protein